jgi:hypothetical protein
VRLTEAANITALIPARVGIIPIGSHHIGAGFDNSEWNCWTGKDIAATSSTKKRIDATRKLPKHNNTWQHYRQ